MLPVEWLNCAWLTRKWWMIDALEFINYNSNSSTREHFIHLYIHPHWACREKCTEVSWREWREWSGHSEMSGVYIEKIGLRRVITPRTKRQVGTLHLRSQYEYHRIQGSCFIVVYHHIFHYRGRVYLDKVLKNMI